MSRVDKKIINEKEYEKISQLLYNKKIDVYIGLNWVADKDKISFTLPLLRNVSITTNKLLKFLKDSISLEVTITNRKPDNFNVYYSGTIKNQNGETLLFENVDNGFCVNIG